MAVVELDNQSTHDPNRLTAHEKYRKFRARSPVEVKIVSRVGYEPTWVSARVVNTNKGGAWCRLKDGRESFYHWNEVREPPPSTEPASLASLGEVLAAKQPPILRSVPPFVDTTPNETPPPPRSDVLLISREELGMPPANHTRSPTDRKPNAIGAMFRKRREARGWTQGELAKEISKRAKTATTNKEISEIELGGYPPSDSELLGFAELFSMDLQELIDLRESSPTIRVRGEKRPWGTVQHPAPRVAPARAPAPTASPLPPPPVPAPPPEPPPAGASAATGEFENFIEALCQAAPIPIERERRQEWFKLAVKLYGLSG